MRKIIQLLATLLLGITISVSAENGQTLSVKSVSNSIKWGVNIHKGGNDPQNVANKLIERNLKFVRMDLWGHDPVYLSSFLNAANIMQSQNIKIQVVVHSSFSRGQPRSQDYTADTAEVAQYVYNQIKPGIISTKGLVLEYELQNEVPLYPDIILSGATGQNASDYNTPAGRLQAAALRGMSKAINDVRKQYNLPIRIILGTVSRDFGFITYMQQQGVLFDIIGYHIYPWERHAALDQDPWFGIGGPLGQLSKFNKPIHINEFNSGEITSGASYSPGTNYENQAGQPLTETGYKSLYKHLNEIVNQTVANVESVYFYEVYDQAQNAIPENRFGLYYDTNMEKPKISLLLATAYAGGALSQAEKDSLIKRNFVFNFVTDTTNDTTTYTTDQFYLIPSSQWLSNNATFGAIFKNGATEVKVPFILNSSTGMYKLTIPAGSWPQICLKRYSTDGMGDWGGFATYDAVLQIQSNNFITYNKAYNCISVIGWANGTDPSQYNISTYPVTSQVIIPQSTGVFKSAYGLKNQLVVNAQSAAHIELYTITGQLLHKETITGRFIYPVNSGVYLLRVNGETRKIPVP
ncbi:MAG: hypothetical protein BGN96_09445 [Bacteroidales bacterium 45-6]|uniref:T9SS type A sorting domain-containing protein n=1 Tax=uncultured Dysgonomonas sp. TaxID=206096 RepID=UPI00095BD79C|nr:T9SS type A sorting domain-containing protein [uncultured Dysgonomonas sp.]OJU53507.1 MAG: hypothetical protein BGN96_09445 [Bacteroidales bacterium 45-6]